ncbi:U32 family peptidase C-terminal domain-containing protein [Thermodesulforhabdus norvegica]|uniref:Putative protease n=1 Tax=Thermodesulforhabdus norvegica TaxID=39841 RepID=A0A1I4S6D7_9BACT|nr:U32 family peptidase C-terminal domain-containing protein [Thermodesulforhabdus norvegica]SFM59833.1 putative protease [Thermodesulforhabdus norvegica]
MKERITQKPELLAPGGSLTSAIIAIIYGADAVYTGIPELSLRDGKANLGDEEIAHLVYYARKKKKRVYVALNVFARNKHIKIIPSWLEYLSDLKPDGIIVSDPGVIRLCKRYAPDLPVHLSTQANTTNKESLFFWKEVGVSRVNLARELSYDELREICEDPPVEVEIFVHGAMCVSYSGRCLLSALFTNRSANLGKCAHPCRWSYLLVEPGRPDEPLTLIQEGSESYILNSRDLCLLEKVGDIIRLGVHALKIEGRRKSFLYAATVTNVYRRAIDAWTCGSVDERQLKSWRKELEMVSHRPYTTGFLFPDYGSLTEEKSSSYSRIRALAGIVIPRPEDRPDFDDIGLSSRGEICIQVRHTLDIGNELEFLFPDGSVHGEKLKAMETLQGSLLKRAHPGMIVRIPVECTTFPYQVIRLKT